MAKCCGAVGLWYRIALSHMVWARSANDMSVNFGRTIESKTIYPFGFLFITTQVFERSVGLSFASHRIVTHGLEPLSQPAHHIR